VVSICSCLSPTACGTDWIGTCCSAKTLAWTTPWLQPAIPAMSRPAWPCRWRGNAHSGAVRRVEPGPVDDRIVLRCLELALEAPTASNGQSWEFVVVKDRAVKASLAAQYRRAWRLYGELGRLVKTDEQTARS